MEDVTIVTNDKTLEGETSHKAQGPPDSKTWRQLTNEILIGNVRGLGNDTKIRKMGLKLDPVEGW